MARLLIVEGQPAARTLIEDRLDGNLTIRSTTNVHTALDDHSRSSYDVVVWDTVSAPTQQWKTIPTIKKFLTNLETRAIVISDAQENGGPAVQDGRCEWLRNPVDETEFLGTVAKAIRSKAPDTAVSVDASELLVPVEFEGILAFTLNMRAVIQHIMEAAAEDIPVLISGETGTGKDLVAAAIHKRSQRKNFPYLPINMGAIAPELVASELFGHEKGAYTGASDRRSGLFEQAQGGTIFLDEITATDAKTQVSLLRVLETKTVRRVCGDRSINVDVRVIAATNDDIEAAVKEGRFREDLYYRLDVFRIHLPPLRERHSAISLLTDHFVARFAELYKKEIRAVPRETYRLVRQYPWPGNIRELKNVIQRAVLLAKGAELTPDLLPQRIHEAGGSTTHTSTNPSPIQLGMTLEQVEREFLKMTLASVSGNKKQAAAILGISRRALYNKLKRFGML
jgi:DNA-binding NtrC family response regulator